MSVAQSAVPATKSACLPRNLPFEVHQVLCLPRNLHFKGFTKCCACHEICTSRFTKCCACHEICASRFTKRCTCHEICKRATCPKSKSHDSLHLSRNLSSSTIATMSKLLRLPRKLHFEVKQLRSLAPVTKSRLWSTKARGFPSDHHVRKCARRHNESAVVRSARPGRPDFVSLRSRNALRGFREA